MGPGLEPPPVDAGNEGETEAHQDAAGVDEESAWYDELKLGAFVDGYAGINLSTPKPQLGRNRFHAYNLANGFSLAWGGLDVEYGAQEFAGTLSLRFGPSASALAGGDAEHGLENVKQAFASWRPSSKFSLDFGKFDTIYGAEVADSQANFNYTRGLLYWLGQPVFHTGLRAAIDISPQFWITALAVNGWNNTIDNNSGKTFGVQFSTSIPRGSDETPLLDVHLGYLAGPEQRDYGVLTDYCPPGETFNPGSGACDASNPASSPTVQRDAGAANNVEAFRHFIDLVANFHPSNDLSLLLNFDVGFEGTRVGSPDDYGALNEFDGQSWWGLAVGARYAFSPVWAGALRGEVFGDPDARATSGDDPHVNDVQDLMLYSGTLTIEAAPSDNLLFRLDARLDGANEAVFPRQLRSYEQIQPTLVLGVVATTN